MNFKVNRNDLHKALGSVTPLAGSLSGLPILGSVLLEATNGNLTLTTTNLQTALQVTVPCEVIEEGSLCVPAETFAKYVSLLAHDAMIFATLEPNEILKLECEGSVANLKGVTGDEYPLVETPPDDLEVFTLGAYEFKTLMESVIICASKDDNRPILTALNLRLTADGLTLAAADGFRLVRARTANVFGDDLETNIPVSAIQTLLKAMGKPEDDDQIHFAVTPTRLYFHSDNFRMMAAPMEGKFPDYEVIIPTEHKTQVKLVGEDLHQAVLLVETFAKDSANALSLDIGDVIKVFGRSQEKGENTSTLDAKVEGEHIKLSLNYAYLKDITKMLADNNIILESNSPAQPLVLYPQGSGDDLLYVIMPMTAG